MFLRRLHWQFRLGKERRRGMQGREWFDSRPNAAHTSSVARGCWLQLHWGASASKKRKKTIIDKQYRTNSYFKEPVRLAGKCTGTYTLYIYCKGVSCVTDNSVTVWHVREISMCIVSGNKGLSTLNLHVHVHRELHVRQLYRVHICVLKQAGKYTSTHH